MSSATQAAEPVARSAPSIAGLTRLAQRDMEGVDALIRNRMQSPVSVIPALAEHLIGGSAKRLRPLLTIAAARLAGAKDDACLNLAAAVEFIHTATLLHDDVIDSSELRRGKVAAHLIWGAPASVLVGDFLFARSFELMVEAGSMPALEILARDGQQALNLLRTAGSTDYTENDYVNVVVTTPLPGEYRRRVTS